MNKIYALFSSLLFGVSPVFAAKAGEMLKTTGEFQFVMMKFLKVMAGIAVSSVVIFVILLIFKQIHLRKKSKLPNSSESLASPEDVDSSVRTFLEKSRVD